MVTQKFKQPYHNVFKVCKEAAELQNCSGLTVEYNKGLIKAIKTEEGDDLAIRVINGHRTTVEIEWKQSKGLWLPFSRKHLENRLLKMITGKLTGTSYA